MIHKMKSEILKAEVLVEAIPYIRRFAGSVVVVKYGGSAMVDEALCASVIQDIAMLKYIGLKPVVVHGGGNEITSMLTRLGKKTEFIDGLRITDAETAKIARWCFRAPSARAWLRSFRVWGSRQPYQRQGWADAALFKGEG